MAIAMTLRDYLDEKHIEYDTIKHQSSSCSSETAQAAHIPGDQLAKSVLLEDDSGYLMAVIPSTHRVQIGKLHKHLHRNLGLATERELESLFNDCETGAIPPLAQAYGIEVVFDDAIRMNSDVYFEAGDHTELVHVSREDFLSLMADAHHGHFSKHI